jgi:hypothetical protein
MKNYIISFLDKTQKGLTAEEAALIAQQWQKGGLIMFDGAVYASHQICSIVRVDKQTEKDMCEIEGVNYLDVPTIEKLLDLNQKQINGIQ